MRQAMVDEPLAPGVEVVCDAEQHLFADVFGCPAGPCGGQGWRKDHHQFFGMQTVADQPRQVAGRDYDGGVDAAGREVDGFDPRIDMHQYLGVAAVELMQARQQPFGAKGWQGRQAQAAAAGLMGNRVQGGAAHTAQCFADFSLVQAPDIGELDGAAFTTEQCHPQLAFQDLDLAADGALCQRQFCGCAGVALVAGSGLKGQQQGHGWGEVAVIHS